MMPDLKDLIDIHTHILPGIDDGPRDLEQSLALARCYQDSGVTTVVATPHFIPGTAWATPKEQIVAAVEQLQEELDAIQVELKILPGMEIGFHRKLITRLKSGELLPLGSSNHYLIEPSFQGEQQYLIDTLMQLSNEGIQIILAHPERVEEFQQNPDFLGILVDIGVHLQVNSGSLLGYFGRRARKLAEKLQENGYLHFIASDAHHHTSRPPLRLEEWQLLLERPGGTEILRKCVNNVVELLGSGG